MGSIYGRLGFNANDAVTASATSSYSTGANNAMMLMPPMVTTWQQNDISNSTANGYFTNPVANVTYAIEVLANTIVTVANTTTSSNATISNTLFLTANVANSLFGIANNFLYITNRQSNVVPVGNDTTTPHYTTAIGNGKILSYLVYQSDEVQNNSPIMGNFTSITLANTLNSLANTLNVYTTLFLNSIAANTSNISLANALLLYSTTTQIANVMTMYPAQDTQFFQNSQKVLNDFGVVNQFKNMGQTENFLITNYIGTKKLVSSVSTTPTTTTFTPLQTSSIATSTPSITTNSGTFYGNLIGNASTATNLLNSQNFSIAGDVIASNVSFNGTAPVVLNASLNTISGLSSGTYGSDITIPSLTIAANGRVISASSTALDTNTYDAISYSTSVLISRFIPSNIWVNIVSGTNTVAVDGYIQTALNYCANNGTTLVFSPYTYKMSNGVTYNYGTHSITGNGALLDYSGITTAGVCFSVTTLNNFTTLWYLAVYAVTGLNIKGVNYGVTQTSGLIGVQFGIGLANSGAHASFQNCSVSGFDTGVNFGDHSYVQKIDSCAFHNCNTAILYSGATLNDSGERIGFTNCVIFNSLVLAHAIAGELAFTNCSFDYFTRQAVIAELGGSVYISDSHIESINNPNLAPWLYATNSNSRICLNNVIIVINNTVSVYIGLADDSTNGGDTGVSDAGIYLNNTHVSVTPTGGITLPTLFKGAVYVKNLTSFDGGRYSANNARVNIYVDRNNLLADGSFEENSTPIEWTISTGTGYTSPTVVNTRAVSGNNSLSINPAANTITQLYKSFQVSPGAKPSLGFQYIGTIANGATMNVTVGYAASSGYSAGVSSRTFTYSFTNANANSTAWIVETLRPYAKAPIGATRFTVNIAATYGVNVNMDAIMVEILDNHVSGADLNDTSIDKLLDVDTTTVPPTNGQTLVYNSNTGIWIPGTITGGSGGGIAANSNQTITGSWSFPGGANVANFTFSGDDLNDKTTAANTGLTVNYQSSFSSTTPFPYYRDFTVFNGKGLAAMKIVGVSRTALFYSGLQFGQYTASQNQISFTGGQTDPGDGGEIAFNYNSGFDSANNIWSFPYYRNTHFFDGKGGGMFKISGLGRRIDYETDSVYMISSLNFKGVSNTYNTLIYCNAATASRTINVPDASGTIDLQEWVGPQINTTPVTYQTGNYTISANDSVILLNTLVANTVTLPAATTNKGKLFRLSNVGANTVTILSSGGSIQWISSQSLAAQTQKALISDGNNWFWC